MVAHGQSRRQHDQEKKDPCNILTTSLTQAWIPGAFEYRAKKKVINRNGKHAFVLLPEGITILFYVPRQMERRDRQKKRMEKIKKTNFHLFLYIKM